MSSPKINAKASYRLGLGQKLLLLLLPVVVALAALCFGRIMIAPREVFLAVWG